MRLGVPRQQQDGPLQTIGGLFQAILQVQAVAEVNENSPLLGCEGKSLAKPAFGFPSLAIEHQGIPQSCQGIDLGRLGCCCLLQHLNCLGQFPQGEPTTAQSEKQLPITGGKGQALFIGSRRFLWVAKLHPGIAQILPGRHPIPPQVQSQLQGGQSLAGIPHLQIKGSQQRLSSEQMGMGAGKLPAEVQSSFQIPRLSVALNPRQSRLWGWDLGSPLWIL